MSATKQPQKLVLALDPEFGAWLRRARESIPMSLQDFARRAGLGRGTVGAFELGNRPEGDVGVEVFVRLARGLGMDLGYVLHKAGLDLGPDGINLAKLRRVEATVQAFVDHESDLRIALAEAIGEFDKPGQGNDSMIVGLARGLAALDRVTERMRREGFAANRQPGEVLESERRPWTDADRQFVVDNPNLSNDEIAAHLGRTADSVKAARTRSLNGGTK